MNSILNSEFTIHYFPTNRLTLAPATLYARCPEPAKKLKEKGNNRLTSSFGYCLVLSMAEADEYMYENKYEKSFDNRCAAMVSRILEVRN